MKIVGVGCGPGMVTGMAARAIAGAAEIYGSRRAIELAAPHIRPGCPVHEIADYKALRSLPTGAVVLSTGDPMLSGLGYLEGEVIPGISSLQVAASRLRIPLARFSIVSAHGRDHRAAVAEVRREVEHGKTVFLLADPAFDILSLARELGSLHRELTITLCEDLGYPGERVESGTPEAPPLPAGVLYALVISPEKGPARGPD
jgi:cobalt-precorrin-7 (C5)-methyltransferase